MNVTSLLNSGAKLGQLGHMAQLGQLGPRGEPLDLTPTPSVVSNTTAASTGVATPPPEKSPSRSNSESRTPNRSRTPWDAGGYSLPLTLDTKMIRTPMTAKPILYGESPTGEHHLHSQSPPSPKHKFSDSRSSLSSCYTTASSNNSGSHSRISSLSTVSEFQPMTNLITEFSSLEAKISDENERQNLNGNSTGSNSSGSSFIHGDAVGTRGGLGSDGGMDGMLTGDGMGGGMMDARIQQPLSPYSMNNASLDTQAESGTNNSSESDSSSERHGNRSDRARSPSDAILFTSSAPPARGQVAEAGRRVLDAFNVGYQPGHKRAASAPDFPSTVRTRYQPSVGFAAPIVEPPYSPAGFYSQPFGMGDQGQRRPSLASEEDPYGEDPSASVAQSSQSVHQTSAGIAPTHVHDWDDAGEDVNDTAALAMDDDALCEASDYEDEAPSRCLWGNQPCDTGSQLRKAVSHIFGRNKLCTRQIPDSAWVHFCRKHYQRARYRLGANYSLTQVRLVIRQINKIRKWSDHNAARGRSSGVVSSWRIQLRKREEKRQETKQQGKKRPRDDDIGGIEDVKSEPPQWLIEKVGDGYSTDDVLAIAWHLKEDLHNKLYAKIPDVEILPNITSDRAEETKPRAKPQRRTAPSGQASRTQASRSRMAPYGYQGHRSTLSESSRGGSHLGHFQDVVGLPHWDNPTKRQRGTEYDGQLRQSWLTQQTPTSLPMRPANELGGYTAAMGSSAGDYTTYGMAMPQQQRQPASHGYSVQPGAWGATATSRMTASSYGANSMHSAFSNQTQLSPVPATTTGQQQQYFSGSPYTTNTAQQQQSYFGASPYGGANSQQGVSQRAGLYGDAWAGYGGQNQGRAPGQQAPPARSHQRHVSAPWPNSNIMNTNYQFTSPGTVPQFTGASAMDPALMGGQQQRRSSLPHNQIVAGQAVQPRGNTASMMAAAPQLQQQSSMVGSGHPPSAHGAGSGDHAASGNAFDSQQQHQQQQQFDIHNRSQNDAARYDFSARR